MNIIKCLFAFFTTLISTVCLSEVLNFGDIFRWSIDGDADYNANGLTLKKGSPSSVETTVNVTPGKRYMIKLYGLRSTYDGISYIWSKGAGYDTAMTLIPRSGRDEKETVTFIRSLQSENGTITIGVNNDGSSAVSLSKIEISDDTDSYSFVQGGDITELNYVIAQGGVYKDRNGNPIFDSQMTSYEKGLSVCKYLARNGFASVRIRLSNNPGPDSPSADGKYCLPKGFQDREDCLNLCKMAKEAGLSILYTFNYSDYWSNGEMQIVPKDWQERLNKIKDIWEAVDTLESLVYYYTKEIVQELADNDIYPEFFSLGNEINGGLLYPYAYSYDVNKSISGPGRPEGDANWWAIARIIKAGHYGVKDVMPDSKTIVHLADETGNYRKSRNPNDWTYSWFFDNLNSHESEYDIIGASYYPSWSNSTIDDLTQYLESLMKRYSKDVVIMESGYNWNKTRKDGYKGQLNSNAEEYIEKFPESPIGQKEYMVELLNKVKGMAANNGRQNVLGVYYWDPMMIHVEDQFGNNKTGWADWAQWGTTDVNVVENTTFFDFEGKSLPVFESYIYNRTQTKTSDNNNSSSIITTSTSTSNVTVTGGQGYICVYSNNETVISISTPYGHLSTATIPEGQSHLIAIPGIYIVNGIKVIVY